MFIVTHNPPAGWGHAPFTFVTDRVQRAVGDAKGAAGEGIVGVSGANLVQQCLAAELIDELAIDLVLVLLGEGISFFGELGTTIDLDGPRVVEGDGVTHLAYRVKIA